MRIEAGGRVGGKDRTTCGGPNPGSLGFRRRDESVPRTTPQYTLPGQVGSAAQPGITSHSSIVASGRETSMSFRGFSLRNIAFPGCVPSSVEVFLAQRKICGGRTHRPVERFDLRSVRPTRFDSGFENCSDDQKQVDSFAEESARRAGGGRGGSAPVTIAAQKSRNPRSRSS